MMLSYLGQVRVSPVVAIASDSHSRSFGFDSVQSRLFLTGESLVTSLEAMVIFKRK